MTTRCGLSRGSGDSAHLQSSSSSLRRQHETILRPEITCDKTLGRGQGNKYLSVETLQHPVAVREHTAIQAD